MKKFINKAGWVFTTLLGCALFALGFVLTKKSIAMTEADCLFRKKILQLKMPA